MDGTEVVVKYLQSLPNMTADTQLNRIQLLLPLPAPKFGNPEVQPLRGHTVTPVHLVVSTKSPGNRALFYVPG